MSARPLRSVRVESVTWDAAAARAAREGTTVSAVIRSALRTYAVLDPAELEAPDA